MNIDEALKLLPGVPMVESPFFPQIVETSDWDEETRRIGRDLHEKGYAILDFPEVDGIADRVRESLEDKFDLAAWRGGAGQGLRIQDAWQFNEDVRRIAVNGRIVHLLSTLYGRSAFPFQTLNFPVGTEQHFHSDSIHFSSMPERFMCGVWLAMEDIGEDQGPLVYYPGSHRWPIYSNEHVGHHDIDRRQARQDIFHDLWQGLVKAHGVEPRTAPLRKGQALIWAANLLHGGAPHRDRTKTRWSQVTHYYFDDCAYYTPMLSDPIVNAIFFRQPFNIQTGEPVRNKRGLPTLVQSLFPGFDPAAYLAANGDIAAAGADPFQHYMEHGWKEGRPLRL